MPLKQLRLQAVPADRRKELEALYLQMLRGHEGARLTLSEAAMLYGFTHQTLRHYSHLGRLRVWGKKTARYTTHAAMRAYLRERHPGGRKRKALRDQQTALA